jgi:hypothetical protein
MPLLGAWTQFKGTVPADLRLRLGDTVVVEFFSPGGQAGPTKGWPGLPNWQVPSVRAVLTLAWTVFKQVYLSWSAAQKST